MLLDPRQLVHTAGLARRRAAAALVLTGATLCAGGCSRFSAGGSGSGAGSPPPAADLVVPAPRLPGLLSAVGGPGGSARIDWVAVPADIELALFQADELELVYALPPVAVGLAGDHLLLAGLPPDSQPFFGLGARASAGAAFAPVGAVLRARVGAPIYVDAAADPRAADGAAPATAFASLASALELADDLRGASVWVAAGSYPAPKLRVAPGVHLVGGFGPGFELAQRSPQLFPTVLVGTAGADALVVEGGAPGGVVDGVRIDGGGAARRGIDAVATPVELRGIAVTGCQLSGVRLVATGAALPQRALLVGCVLRANGSEGLAGLGPLDCALEACALVENGEEGVDLDDLVALPDTGVRLAVRDSSFLANAAEGLEVDLVAPSGIGASGRFEVVVRGSLLARNALDGLLVDHDFADAPGFSAAIEISGSTARANGGAGFRLDLDAPGETFLQRVLASANAGAGLRVTSDDAPGLVVVSSSAFAGNLGAGARASEGNALLLLSHCALAGNLGGGALSEELSSAAAASALWMQASPWLGVATLGGAASSDVALDVFARVPRAYARVDALDGAQATLEPAPTLAPGALGELADDGVARDVQPLGGPLVLLDPAPAALSLPALFAAFDAGGVAEDYDLAPGSPGLGAGIAPSGASPTDAGPFGSPAGGAPGVEPLVPAPLFRVATIAPALPLSAGADELRLGFAGGSPDPGALRAGDVELLDAALRALSIDVRVDGDALVVLPPPGGVPAGALLVVHGTLRSTAGLPLAAPVVLPLVAR